MIMLSLHIIIKECLIYTLFKIRGSCAKRFVFSPPDHIFPSPAESTYRFVIQICGPELITLDV